MTQTLVIVQYAGDFRETYLRLRSGGAENYYGQRHSVEGVAALAGPTRRVVTICCTSSDTYDAELAPGVRAIGVRSGPGGVDEEAVWRMVLRCEATHLVLRSPMRGLLRRARAVRMRVLVTVADSFGGRGLRHRWRMRQLVRLLNEPSVEAVGNHGRASALELLTLGVQPQKVTAWDWPHPRRPHGVGVKQAPMSRRWSLFFAGTLSESKGVGDLLRAARELQARGFDFELAIAGGGEAADVLRSLGDELGVADRVQWLGMLPHDAVLRRMTDSDIVVVPSRHDYPEGFPMTLYEALAARTPIVCSDHPMFLRAMVDGRSAMVFSAADPRALADKVLRLQAEPALYAALSEASVAVWESLQVPVEWLAFVRAWFIDPTEQFQSLLRQGREDLARHAR
ncbi:MAG: glycosyltransferase [Aquincola sp.]|nr:glycosyltransferase [Aquincola sp.]